MFKKKKKIVSTFAMKSEKLKELQVFGFTMDECVMLKEELGKIATDDIKHVNRSKNE
jgi:hypothetical protein